MRKILLLAGFAFVFGALYGCSSGNTPETDKYLQSSGAAPKGGAQGAPKTQAKPNAD